MAAAPQSIEFARFDTKLKTYTFLSTLAGMTFSCIGIPLVPFWLIFGKLYAQRYYDSLECELTTRALRVKRGVWFRQEQTIPLDKLQDLSLHEGPILEKFGLCALKIETAGSTGGGQGQADARLLGIVDARAFRDRVIEQRDRVTDLSSRAEAAAPPTSAAPTSAGQTALLTEIRDSLRQIEQHLRDRG